MVLAASLILLKLDGPSSVDSIFSHRTSASIEQYRCQHKNTQSEISGISWEVQLGGNVLCKASVSSPPVLSILRKHLDQWIAVCKSTMRSFSTISLQTRKIPEHTYSSATVALDKREVTRQWYAALSGFKPANFISSKHFKAFSGSEARAQPLIRVVYVLTFGQTLADSISSSTFDALCTK